MTFKTGFEPKEARVNDKENTLDDDDDDEKKKRKRTGTQALVEFLNTTSPEEFQKPNAVKKTSFFARKRKSVTTPVIKKNYMDLISIPFKKVPMLPRRDNCFDGSNGSVTAVRHMLLASSIEDEKSSRLEQLEENEMREDDDDEMIIEKGLQQRLDRYKNSNVNVPSDIVSKVLAHEHIIALENMVKDQKRETNGKRTRCVQVQTIPIETVNEEKESDTQERYENVESELKKERVKRQRLEATLEETMDQFEVLSGLAYKKLREVWEEKVRWENACMQIKERCWQDHQQQITSVDDDNNSSNSSDRD